MRKKIVVTLGLHAPTNFKYEKLTVHIAFTFIENKYVQTQSIILLLYDMTFIASAIRMIWLQWFICLTFLQVPYQQVERQSGGKTLMCCVEVFLTTKIPNLKNKLLVNQE